MDVVDLYSCVFCSLALPVVLLSASTPRVLSGPVPVLQSHPAGWVWVILSRFAALLHPLVVSPSSCWRKASLLRVPLLWWHLKSLFLYVFFPALLQTPPPIPHAPPLCPSTPDPPLRTTSWHPVPLSSSCKTFMGWNSVVLPDPISSALNNPLKGSQPNQTATASSSWSNFAS